MSDHTQRVISSLIFGCKTSAYTIGVNALGHTVDIHNDFVLKVDGKTVPHQEVIRCLKSAGFVQHGSHFQSPIFWEPYHNPGNGLKHLGISQLAHIIFYSGAEK